MPSATTAAPPRPTVICRPVVLTDDEHRQLMIDERVEREIAIRWFRR